eukprot:11212451-Lingulodinium_polyedra.AAC.1
MPADVDRNSWIRQRCMLGYYQPHHRQAGVAGPIPAGISLANVGDHRDDNLATPGKPVAS